MFGIVEFGGCSEHVGAPLDWCHDDQIQGLEREHFIWSADHVEWRTVLHHEIDSQSGLALPGRA